MIEISSVTKTLKKQKVLDNVTVTFEKGKIYGLRGKNGAGKTMLLRAISGLINIDEGQIITSFNAEELREREGKSILDKMREVYKNE